MNKNSKGDSRFVRPLIYFFDLVIINILAWILLPDNIYSFYFFTFISLLWVIIAINTKFYEVFRYTKLIEIVNKSVKQFFLFTIIYYSFLSFYTKNTNPKNIATYILGCILIIFVFKVTHYYALKKFRVFFGGNYKRAIIVGNGENIKLLSELFRKNSDYGYELIREFNQTENLDIEIEASLKFALKNDIDEVYISLMNFNNDAINKFIDFSESFLKTIKFVPENEEIFSNNFQMDYYGYVPVLTLNKTRLHDPITKIFKRFFDIIFSIFVILFFLSWLTPLLAFFIKLESSGPVFFKQGRPGIDEKEFFCYKFRSMKINKTTEKEASKNDPRVTKIGRFIRKTSLDEMPQFINVLLGEMSVVGPRPHLWSQNRTYGNRIKKYMVRHYVKPGITGLAQVRGYRGEIETDEDMINRIKYDVYYIENWSIILDLKIITQTVVNIFKGEEKAY